VIRTQQMEALRTARLREFESRVVRHVKQYFPKECAALGEQGTVSRVRSATARAFNRGLTAQPYVTRFVTLAFALGGDFDQSDKYLWISEIFNDGRYSPEVQLDLVTQLAIQRFDPKTPPQEEVEEEALEAAEQSEAEEEFDGIEIGEEPPAADPDLPEPYDGELPPDPEEEPFPELPDYAKLDPHFSTGT